MPITTVTVQESSQTVPVGQVIRTDPPEGERINDPNAVITIYVSSGPVVGAAGGRGRRLPGRCFAVLGGR